MLQKPLFFLTVLATMLLAFSCTKTSNTTDQTDATTQTEEKADGLIRTIQTDQQEINVYTTEGIQPYLHQKDNKVHVVNFWATWCGPCVKELPYFEYVHQEMNDEVEVTLISLDFEDKLDTNLVQFVNKKEVKSNVIVVLPESEQELMESVSKQWNSGIPATLIYNKHKRYFVEGSLTQEELLSEIEKFKS